MAGKPIATIGSMHVCPMVTGYVPHVGGPVSGPGAPNVLINGKPAALMGDMCVCVGPPDTIAQGEPCVLINGTPVATMGSMTAHGGSITVGEPTVIVSSATPNTKATMPLKKIPFPKINVLQKFKASTIGRSSDLNEAETNQEQLKKNAEEQPRVMVANLQWQKEGNIVDKALVGEEITLCADVEGIEEGGYIAFKIFEKDSESEDDFISSVTGIVENAKVNIDWEVKYVEDKDDEQSVSDMQQKGYTLPEFVFKYDNTNGETIESNLLIVDDSLEIKAIDDETGEVLSNYDYSILLPNGEMIEGQLDEDGYARIESIKPSGNYPIVISKEGKIVSVARE